MATNTVSEAFFNYFFLSSIVTFMINHSQKSKGFVKKARNVCELDSELIDLIILNNRLLQKLETELETTQKDCSQFSFETSQNDDDSAILDLPSDRVEIDFPFELCWKTCVPRQASAKSHSADGVMKWFRNMLKVQHVQLENNKIKPKLLSPKNSLTQ